MTPEELDATIARIITPQTKPRSTQNSYRRKQWDHQRLWRICTIGKSCKSGIYKAVFNDGKAHPDWANFDICSCYGGISGMVRFGRDARLREWSYHNRFIRRSANRHVRRYKDDVGNYSFYRKIFDYEWECW